MTNIRRLAEHLNISIGTVSRALNNRPGVHPETSEKVLKAAAELGYVANQSGRSLRRGATNTIGFVIETGHPANQAGDEFFFVLTDAMNLYLAEQGYDLVILPCHSADDPVEFLQRVIARRTVDALVITATRRQDRRIELLTKSSLPFIALGRSQTPGSYSWIDLDFVGVARRSIAEAVQAGHKRIAVALPDNDANLGYHYKDGYISGLREAGLDFDESLIVRVPSSEQGGFELGRRIIEMPERPTAVLLCSEATTVGLYSSLTGAGLTPGKDLSIIAFRESSFMRFLSPTPARFAIDIASIGTLLGSSVLELLTPGEEPIPPKEIVLPMNFVAGASICPPPTQTQASDG